MRQPRLQAQHRRLQRLRGAGGKRARPAQGIEPPLRAGKAGEPDGRTGATEIVRRQRREVVPGKGLEPLRLAALVPETSASTNSATRARVSLAGSGTHKVARFCLVNRGAFRPWTAPDPSCIRRGPAPARERKPRAHAMTLQANNDTLITVFGGSGFLGRHLVRALAKRHYRIRVAVRRPDLAGHLQPLGRVGQIHAVQANVRARRFGRGRGARRRHRHQPGRHPVRARPAALRHRAGVRRRAGGARRRRPRRAHDPCLGDRRRREFAVGLRPRQGRGREGGAGGAGRTRRSSGRRSCSGRRTTSSTSSPRWRACCRRCR